MEAVVKAGQVRGPMYRRFLHIRYATRPFPTTHRLECNPLLTPGTQR
jgi:hypothetical protein